MFTNTLYGYELSGEISGKYETNLYKTKEEAMAKAEAIAETLKDDETLLVFSTPCDENGKLTTKRLTYIKGWGNS